MGFLIYLLGTIDKLNKSFFMIWVISLGVLLIYGVARMVFLEDEDDTNYIKENFKKTVKTSITLAILFGTLFIFTPSSKTIAAMYLVPKLVENEQVQQIPNKALKLLNHKLDEWVDETVGGEK